MAIEEKANEERIAELNELIFGQGIGGKVPENLPDLVRELLAFGGQPETYVRAILELGCYDFNADVVAMTDEAFQKYPHHAEIMAIKKMVEEIEGFEFSTVIKAGSNFKSVNRVLLRERLDRGGWRLCFECGQVFTTARILSEDREAQALGLVKRRADAQFCHDNCRSRYNVRKKREG